MKQKHIASGFFKLRDRGFKQVFTNRIVAKKVYDLRSEHISVPPGEVRKLVKWISAQTPPIIVNEYIEVTEDQHEVIETERWHSRIQK